MHGAMKKSVKLLDETFVEFRVPSRFICSVVLE